ncbi:KRAB-A domain-containing protein 2-like [Melanaphis sacchari]|uniref:KRAB-A domain-containing protein 2-like n=1 Tax=Melanaphis sacchari TaxID=742174 RepID=UPI000DC12EA8|nr:KRAB-A domain-containing protein 2-like [Melanaphis sacchari]
MAYLGLCNNCQVKKSNPKRGLVIKPILHFAFNSKTQIDLIDMQSKNFNNYRYIMNYQDHLINAPALLHSDNGREFAIITNLNEMWGDIKIIVHGKPRHSQTQASVERVNRDIEQILGCWMVENKSKNWPMALKFV